MTGSLSDLNPEQVLTREDKSIGLLCHVVVDRSVQARACGGLRMLADLSVEELKELARSMTLKYGFLGKPMGGAKAGIVVSRDLSGEKRKLFFRRFGELFASELKSGRYQTGTDMGTRPEDLLDVMAGAGIRFSAEEIQPAYRSGLYTAFGVGAAIEAAAAHRTVDLSKSTIVIEGFGSVGSQLARWMVRNKGAKVTGISTEKGALYRPSGLDVDSLIRLQKEHGDDCVTHYTDAQKLSPEELLTVRSDVLSACARPKTIHAGNVGKLQCKIVCGAANYPVTYEAEGVLFEKGVLSVPHFVASIGGVVGGNLESAGVGSRFIQHFLRRQISPFLRELFSVSEKKRVPMIFLAERYAMRRMERLGLLDDHSRLRQRVRRRLRHWMDRKRLPGIAARPLAGVYLDQRFGLDKGLLADIECV